VLFFCNNGYANAPHCYVCTYIACLVKRVTLTSLREKWLAIASVKRRRESLLLATSESSLASSRIVLRSHTCITVLSQWGGRDDDYAHKQHRCTARLHAVRDLYRRGRCPNTSLYGFQLLTPRSVLFFCKYRSGRLNTVRSHSTCNELHT
jgi:hypothetical protein